MVGGANGPRVADSAQDSGLILASATPATRHPVPVAGLQVWWAGVCQVGGNVRQAAKTNASPQNVLLIITEFIR